MRHALLGNVFLIDRPRVPSPVRTTNALRRPLTAINPWVLPREARRSIQPTARLVGGSAVRPVMPKIPEVRELDKSRPVQSPNRKRELTMNYLRTIIYGVGVLVASPVFATQPDLSNWKSCAIGPLSESADEKVAEKEDWLSVPAWTKSLSQNFYNEPRLLANHGLCNEKLRRVVLCLPAWEENDDKSANWYLICDGVTKRNIKSH
jgi:hypothetical protein